MIAGVKYTGISDEGLVIVDGDGARKTIAADTIIPSLPLKPNTELLEILLKKVPEVYTIGDCARPGLILEAIADGSRVAHNI